LFCCSTPQPSVIPRSPPSERILSEINDRLQEFKNWFHNARHEATAASSAVAGTTRRRLIPRLPALRIVQTMEENSMPKTRRSSTRRDADAIERVREILWPHDDPERQWTPETLDDIAEVVMPKEVPVGNKSKRASDAELRALYGSNAVISRKAGFRLVHLDNPSPGVVRRRRYEFDPATFFCVDCPLCGLMKKSGVIVFNESVFDDEEG
jgi:hypothetical protein